jgi:hypothetical protein
MAEEQLRKAYALMKQGQTKESLALVQSVLKQDKNNVAAWWLMTNLLADDPERQKKALDKVLSLDPNHKLAVQLQTKLSGSPAPKITPAPNPNPRPQPVQTNTKSTEEMNFDWAKLEAKEAGKKESNTSSDSQVTKMASYLLLGIALLFVVGLGIFWGIPTYQFSQINNPSDMILRFYDAAFRGDVVAARTMVCPDMQSTFDTFSAAIASNAENLKAQLGEGATVSFDFSGLTAEVISQDAINATVRVAGQYTLSSSEATEPITRDVVTSDENLDSLRFENGVWCVAKIQ